MSEKPTVLIIGAGFGGLGCARQFVKNGAAKDFNVILVEKGEHFSIGGMWQFVWNSRLTMEETMFPLSKAILPGIKVRTKTTVSKWSPQDKKVVLTNGSTISYDHIVLSPGVVPDPKDVPGIENFVNICSIDHVAKQKQDLEELVAKAKTEKVTFCLAISVNPYKCPPAPYELALLVDEYVRKAGVRDNVRVVLTCPVEYSMPPNTKSVVLGALKEQNVEFLNKKELEKVDSNLLHFKDGSDPLAFDVLWGVWPIRAPDFIQESGLKINPKGTITVDDKVSNTIGTGAPGAHIIGDACRVPFGQAGIPKAGEFAWKMGISVADDIAGKRQPADRSGQCAAEAGFGKGIVLSPNFSDVCNDPENGKPKVGIESVEDGTDRKVAWCNGYLKDIFGENVKPVVLRD
ncbi:unnamed protein product [Cylindrotheca closterium]|uniref:FAD/NAD(P)-binding domain-containing protein n=1 Tax=Cylindrotheca closterium TaxID=2856 RepID=A0AAD2CCB2_9STRA|nr:unnamed protein product [Cylindrotheca closterium]